MAIILSQKNDGLSVLHDSRYSAAVFEFKILKKSKKSRARLGVIKTSHGEIETPSFVPVATRATVRTLDTPEIEDAGSQVLICNTFHLHVAPGENVVKKAGGIHGYMNWKKPLMTDSGGFQVYSLGFGTDHGIGKVLKDEQEKILKEGSQPNSVKITDDGVYFRSPIDGKQLYLSPKVSIGIQEKLGADIMFAFDECPSPLADEKYMRASLVKTHRWAAECLAAKKSKKQALYGIVQGGAFSHLRKESAAVLGGMDFDGYGFGGEFGYDKKTLKKVVGEVADELPVEKPRHILGIGHPEDFAIIAQSGGDTFDCIAPTHYARRGVIFTSKGRLDLRKPRFVKDFKALDSACKCDVCKNYSRSYISSLLRARELSGMKLATMHNLFYFNTLAADVRNKIKKGEL
jgi:queuine tRNA-ribosyltransferase/7-cyano-7-deazaguanine tRNA-ribosyltransferase